MLEKNKTKLIHVICLFNFAFTRLIWDFFVFFLPYHWESIEADDLGKLGILITMWTTEKE